MNKANNKRYQIIWRFLKQNLSVVEEEELMKWLEEEKRNQDYFDEVVQDFEMFFSGSNIRVSLENRNAIKGNFIGFYQHWLFKVAASIVMILGITYLFSLNYEKPKAIVQTILLYDSTQIVLSAGSQLIYDSAHFPETHSLQIRGKARIIPPENKESLLLIQTDLGYYFSQNAEFSINNQADRNLEIVMLNGEAQWLSLEVGHMELDVMPGEKLIVKRNFPGLYKQTMSLAEIENKSYDFFQNNLLKLTI